MNTFTDSVTRVDVKQAVRTAKAYLLDVYDTPELPNLLLEEVEFSDAENAWLVTFSFTTGGELEVVQEEHSFRLSTSEPERRIWRSAQRSYKLVKVSPDGNALNMKNRAFL